MVESNISANEDNKFSVSLLAFWVKGSIISDKNFVHIDMPNTILFGLIPAGKNKKNIPLQSISNAQESNWYKVSNMIFGAIIALAGFYSMKDSAFGGLILALLGVLLFLTGFKFRMVIERNSGVTEPIDVPFFEGEKIRKLVSEINDTVASYQQSYNYRDYGAQNAQAIVNAIQNQQLNNSVPQNQQVVNTPVNNTQAQPSASIPNPAPDAQVDSSTGSDTNMTSQFCPNCGAQNDASSSFCTSCGTKLN